MKDLSNLSVLIVDDDQLYVNQLSHWAKGKTKNISIAYSAENGSHFVASVKPDVIFIDNKLPALNGTEVVELYKEVSPDSKIILMSSSFNVDEVALAIQKKADYLINKDSLDQKEFGLILEAYYEAKREGKSIWKILKTFASNTKENRNIVIVEDDEMFSFHLSWRLDLYEQNFNINSFSDGTSFMKECKDCKPDIVFLDYNLPDYNAAQLLDFVKITVPKAKVIVISSQDDHNVAIDLVKKGIHGYIIKNKTWRTNLDEYVRELI